MNAWTLNEELEWIFSFCPVTPVHYTYTSSLEIYAFIFFNTNLFFFSEVNYIKYYLENSFVG